MRLYGEALPLSVRSSTPSTFVPLTASNLCSPISPSTGPPVWIRYSFSSGVLVYAGNCTPASAALPVAISVSTLYSGARSPDIAPAPSLARWKAAANGTICFARDIAAVDLRRLLMRKLIHIMSKMKKTTKMATRTTLVEERWSDPRGSRTSKSCERSVCSANEYREAVRNGLG
jgi:hypothetical protein